MILEQTGEVQLPAHNKDAEVGEIVAFLRKLTGPSRRTLRLRQLFHR